MSNQKIHQPVLLLKAIAGLNLKPEQWYVDATFGRGGHTAAMLEAGANVIAFDFDQEAVNYGQDLFSQEIEAGQLILLRQNFANISSALKELRANEFVSGPILGILFDFGTTQDQLKSKTRGFSFATDDAKLDMRMDKRLGVKASDLLNILSVKQMIQMFKDYGGERHAKGIARKIDKYRGKNRQNKIETVGELVRLVEQVKQRRGRLHPATKVFQALRIVVNDELNNIKQALPQAWEILINQGRIVTIAFHEGEDRIAKHQFKDWQEKGKGEMLTKKPIQPSEAESKQNPASRSAKLRIFTKHGIKHEIKNN
jgi:16S rRNA (cytosine1402-N4)-methyltransferase